MLSTAYQEVEKTADIFEDALRNSQTQSSTRLASGSAKNHYYQVGGIEVIDFIKAKLTEDQYRGYLLGNIYKYSGRCQYKGEYVKDVLKLAEYTKWLKELDDPNN